MKLTDINIRDPYILCSGDWYYMYGTEQRPVGERQKDLTVLKVRIWRTGKDHLKFFTNRKIFGQIVVSGLRNVMKLMESIIWLPHWQ